MGADNNNRPKITFSTETLYHFSCEVCKKWWSIADWEPTIELICPHCGTKSEVTLNKSRDSNIKPKNIEPHLGIFIDKANELILNYRNSLESLTNPTSMPLHITCGKNNNIVAVTLISPQESIIGIYCGESSHRQGCEIGSRNYILYTPSGFKLVNSNNISCHQYLILKKLTDNEKQSQKMCMQTFLKNND